MIHVLKTWPPYFQDVVLGEKTFEIRKDDRPFAKRDYLILREWADGHYTGRTCCVAVYYVADLTPLYPGMIGMSVRLQYMPESEIVRAIE